MVLFHDDASEVKMRRIVLEAALPLTEYSHQFLEGMLNRMGMSHHKYGTVVGSCAKIDHIAGALKRIERFQADGNGEWLMDAANMLMIAFMCEQHPNWNFTPQDSDTSPGRVGKNGAKGTAHNDSRLWDDRG